jgi:hypothetical protein
MILSVRLCLYHWCPAGKSICHSGNQLVRNSGCWGKPQPALLVFRSRVFSQAARPYPQRFPQFVSSKPLRIFQFRVMSKVDVFAPGDGLADRADHQIRRVRPRLGRMDHYTPKMDSALLPYFATHSFFHGLGGFEEASKRAVPMRRPAFLASKQHALTVCGDDCHNHSWVRPREAQVRDSHPSSAWWPLRALDCRRNILWRASSLEASIYRKCGISAGGAVWVPRVPVKHVTRFGVYRSYAVVSPRCSCHTRSTDLPAPASSNASAPC